jgi:hypothetical protein
MAFPRAQIAAHLHDAEHGKTPQIRGRALERAAIAMFTSIPGVLTPEPNVLDYAHATEIDSLFPNRPNNNGLWFTNERAFLCECKNWNVAAGAPELIVFLQKMKRRNCKLGVLVSSEGITGDAAALTAANDVVDGALAEGYEIIVLDWDDLVSIRSANALVKKMQKRWVRLKSYRTSV